MITCKQNNDTIIHEIPKCLADAFKLMIQLPNDFFADGRKDEPPQERNFSKNE